MVEDSVVDSTAHSIQGKIDMTECHCWEPGQPAVSRELGTASTSLQPGRPDFRFNHRVHYWRKLKYMTPPSTEF